MLCTPTRIRPPRRPLREGDYCAFAFFSREELESFEGQTPEGVNAPTEKNAFRPGPQKSVDLTGLSDAARELLRTSSVSTDSDLFRRIVAERHPWTRLQDAESAAAGQQPEFRSGPPPPPTDPIMVEAPDLDVPRIETPGLEDADPPPEPLEHFSCDLPVTAGVDQLPAFEDVCRIHLGELALTDGSLIDLFTELPSDYRPSRSREAMLSACAPWLVEALDAPARQGFTEIDAHGMIWYPSMMATAYAMISPAGLFWPEGYFHNASILSLLLLHRYADLAEAPAQFAEACDFSAAGLRNDMESGRFGVLMFAPPVCGWRDVTDDGFFTGPVFEIDVDTWGKVRPRRTYHGASGWALLQNVHVCAAMKMEAALADYYLWWAQRLFSYVMDGLSQRPLWDLYMAIACVRCGIAELFELGALIVHEYAHLFGGSLWHCSNNRGTYSCCQFAIEFVYRNRASALLGLPIPHMAGGRRRDDDLPVPTLVGWLGLRLRDRNWVEMLTPGDCPRGPEMSPPDMTPIQQPTFRCVHDGILEPHTVEFIWNLGELLSRVVFRRLNQAAA